MPIGKSRILGSPMSDLREHPDYLDDGEVKAFVRLDLAATADEARAFARSQELIEDVEWQNVDVVWMKQTDDPEWYDVTTEAEGVVRYWRLVP